MRGALPSSGRAIERVPWGSRSSSRPGSGYRRSGSSTSPATLSWLRPTRWSTCTSTPTFNFSRATESPSGTPRCSGRPVDVYLRDSASVLPTLPHHEPALLPAEGPRVPGHRDHDLGAVVLRDQFPHHQGPVDRRSRRGPGTRNASSRTSGARRKHSPARYHRLYLRAAREFGELRAEGNFFPNKRSAKEIGLQSTQVALENLTGAFGGAHCLTATLERA